MTDEPIQKVLNALSSKLTIVFARCVPAERWGVRVVTPPGHTVTSKWAKWASPQGAEGPATFPSREGAEELAAQCRSQASAGWEFWPRPYVPDDPVMLAIDQPDPAYASIVLQFSEPGFGFGEITLRQTARGVFIDSEQMSRERIKRYFNQLIDGAVFDWEEDPAKRALYEEETSAKYGPTIEERALKLVRAMEKCPRCQLPQGRWCDPHMAEWEALQEVEP